MQTTAGTLLGGRVRYAQPARGFRSGIEPVLLAASVPARPGEIVLEGGSGAGAALLCLAMRVPGLRGVGIERDPALAALAQANAGANAVPGVEVVAGDVLALPVRGPFDHAFANPPVSRGRKHRFAGRSAGRSETSAPWAWSPTGLRRSGPFSVPAAR